MCRYMVMVCILWFVQFFFFSSRRRHTRCALVTGVQTCALPICTAPGPGLSPAIDTVDPQEVARFSAMAAEWWDPAGKFRPLHKFNPTRQIGRASCRERVCQYV